jgi:hypothetical protein
LRLRDSASNRAVSKIEFALRFLSRRTNYFRESSTM